MTTKTQNDSIFDWFKRLDVKENGIWLTVIIGILGGAMTYGYNTFSLPTDGKRIESIELHLEKLETSSTKRDSELLLLKKSVNDGNNSLEDFKTDTKTSLVEIRGLLFESIKINKTK